MASKVLVPTAPFAKLQIKKSPPESSGGGGGFIIGSSDAVARVAHLEHSVRFLQEQHRQMLSGLHTEIEALRERNRDLQFQLIFNKESSPKLVSPPQEEASESNEEANLKREVSRLEREAVAARSEARAAEARALQLQRLLDAQAQKLRELESHACTAQSTVTEVGDGGESGAELRARLADAERLVRRLRADADRQRRELQCMKNSLHASLRASGLDAYGYQNNYHFPPVHTPDFWREPIREDFTIVGTRRTRRPITLPELSGQQMHRSTIYANHHTRSRPNGYEHKNTKKGHSSNDAPEVRTTEEPEAHRFTPICTNGLAISPGRTITESNAMYPELKVVVTKLIPHENVMGAVTGAATGERRGKRGVARRPPPDHT